MFRTAFVLVLMAAAAAGAQTPRVTGNTKADPYTIVKLKAEGLNPKAGVLWRTVPAVSRADVPAREGLQFTAPPGTYSVQLVAVRLNEDGATDIEEVSVTVTIGGTVPPKPGPAPGPGPAPAAGLAAVSRTAADAVNDPTGRAALAGKQRGLASAIAAGGAGLGADGRFDPAAALAAWREGNRAAVDPTTWRAWGTAVGTALNEEYKAGRLPDKAAWVAAFNSIADGLE